MPRRWSSTCRSCTCGAGWRATRAAPGASAAGRVDAAATAAHRDALRAARRQWPARRAVSNAPALDALTRVGPLGDQLDVARDAEGAHWTRCRCGRVLAPARESWRAYAGRT